MKKMNYTVNKGMRRFMIMYTKNITLFLLKSFIVANVMVSSLFITSCSDEKEEIINDGYQYITFTVATPYSSVPTYAMSDNAENTVQTIDVLAFRVEGGNELYTYRAKGQEIQDIQNGNQNPKKEFKVSLRKDENIDYRFVIIANAAEELDALTTTQTAEKSQLLARLLSKNTGIWNATSDINFKPLPMWGETSAPMKITDAVKIISDIYLLRSVASINVVVGASLFDLKEVYLYNRKTRGRIVPIESHYVAAQKKVNSASMPLDNPADPLTIWEGLGYTASNNEFENTIYTYEAPAASKDEDATCIVIGGKYDGSSSPTTYYRLDFVEKDNNGIFTGFMDILRNHKYTINITSVTDHGYGTPDEAFYGKKLGITVEIEDWNMSDMTEVVVDENYFLKVSQGAFSLNTSGEYYGTVAVQTSHPAGWEVATPDSWISITTKGATYFNFKVVSNSSGGRRDGMITVKAGNLKKDIKVSQPLLN